MPVLAATIVVSAIGGLVIPRATVAYLFAGALALLANIVFVWAIADGKGDDPAWLLLISLAAAAIALAATRVAVAIRRSLKSRRIASAA